MSDLEVFKVKLMESLFQGAELGIKEKLDPHVDELAGSLIAAGPQKVGDAVAKMDPVTFAEFAKKIDAQGILLVTKQFANTPQVTQTNTGEQPLNATPSVPQENQELADL